MIAYAIKNQITTTTKNCITSFTTESLNFHLKKTNRNINSFKLLVLNTTAQAFLTISLFSTPHIQSSILFPHLPFKISSLQFLFYHVWRGMVLRAEKQTRHGLTWIPKVSSPSCCKKKDWPVLSEVVRPLYFISWGCPVASATRVRLIPADCSIMRGEQGLLTWLNLKKQCPNFAGMRFCCVVVNCIWASSSNPQHSGKSCQNMPVFI